MSTPALVDGNEAVDEGQQWQWRQWCRLCAKEDELTNTSVFDDPMGDANLLAGIGKYFWVNIKPSDELSHMLCTECYQLITLLTRFGERVTKVQAMFSALHALSEAGVIEPNEIRKRYRLLDEEREHIIQIDCKQEHPETFQLVIEDSDIKVLKEPQSDEEHQEEEQQQQQQEQEELLHETEYDFDDEDEDEMKLKDFKCEKVEEEGTRANDNGVDVEDEELQELTEEEAEPEAQPEEDEQEATPEEDELEAPPEEDEIEDSDLYKELKLKDDKKTLKEEDAKAEVESSGHELEVISAKRKRGRARKSDGEPEEKRTKKPRDDEFTLRVEYRYDCSLCGKKYKNATSYRKHMLEAHQTAPDIPDFKCEKCGKIFPTERQLHAHERTHLTLEEKMDIPCPYCEKKFTKTSVMRQHVSGVHYNMKPFICDECGRALKTLAALNEHKLVHTTECPCICTVCKKGFKNKARLKVHFDTHTDTAYVCIECGLQLNTRRTLKMHMLVHSDKKQYKCDFCKAEFKRSKALKNHLILHTGMRPYKCNFCERTFSNGSNCRSHKKKAHATELAQEEAEGKKTEPIIVPKLEELRSKQNLVENPRLVQRHSGGLPAYMRALLIAAEERETKKLKATAAKQQTKKLCDSVPQEVEIDVEYEEPQQTIDAEYADGVIVEEVPHAEGEDEEDDDEEEETVIYEIIDEI